MRVYNLLPAEYAISSIALRRIKISRYGELNDPFELMAGHVADQAFRKALKQLKVQFHNEKGVICFSRSWKNPVLWSHYGDRHRGVALGFDIQDEYANVINYSAERLPPQFVDGKPDRGLDENFVGRMIHTKYQHWAYEEEVRLHVSLDEGTKEGSLFFYDFGPSLTLREVILGHECTVSITKVRELVGKSYDGVAVTKARLAFQTFSVVTDMRSCVLKE